VDPQSQQRSEAFAGPAGRPRRRRVEEAKSESDWVRGKEVGMVDMARRGDVGLYSVSVLK
jgi:hypothetical protein